MQNKLFRQKEIRSLGVFFNVLYLTLPIISLFGYIGIALTTYATFVTSYLPWLPLHFYLIGVIVLAVVVMYLFWTFVYLGYFRNPIGRDVEKIKKKLGIEEE